MSKPSFEALIAPGIEWAGLDADGAAMIVHDAV
jgi:hypothetical protein